MSLVEILVTLAVTSALMLIVYALISDTMKAAMFGESHNDLTIMSQQVVNRLQNEIMQSRVAFQEDAIGSAYRDALQIPASVTKWPDLLLPVFQTESTLDPDTGAGVDRRAGNTLLVARQLSPLSVLYDDDGKPATPDVEMLIDRYRFEYYFLARNKLRNFSGSGFYADLMESRSVEYADYFQLNSLSAAQLMSIVPKIQAAGVTSAWDPGKPLGNAFYDLAPAAAGAFGAAIAAPKISLASTNTLMPEMRGGRITGMMEYSVAFLPAAPKKPFPITKAVSFYAKPDAAYPTFPAGFEVKIAGPAGNRKVGLRVLLMALYGASTYESQQASLTASATF